MESLPNIEVDGYLSDEEGVLEYYSIAHITDLYTVVKEYVDADCHAVVLDGEVLYNSYRDCSHRERILDFVIRKQISQSPHRHLFVPLLRQFRQNRDFSVEIYMFSQAAGPWKLVIRYDHVSDGFWLHKKV